MDESVGYLNRNSGFRTIVRGEIRTLTGDLHLLRASDFRMIDRNSATYSAMIGNSVARRIEIRTEDLGEG